MDKIYNKRQVVTGKLRVGQSQPAFTLWANRSFKTGIFRQRLPSSVENLCQRWQRERPVHPPTGFTMVPFRSEEDTIKDTVEVGRYVGERGVRGKIKGSMQFKWQSRLPWPTRSFITELTNQTLVRIRVWRRIEVCADEDWNRDPGREIEELWMILQQARKCHVHSTLCNFVKTRTSGSNNDCTK